LIAYLATAPHLYTIGWFLEEWEPGLRDRIQLRSYEEALADRRDAPGTYVFADIERLSPDQLRDADGLWLRLARLGDRVRLLNRPLETWRRRELLRRMHGTGTNSFRVRRFPSPRAHRMLGGRIGSTLARAGDVRGARRLAAPLLRFPVFIRSASEHDGNLSSLLYGWRQLREAADEVVRGGRDPADLLIVEFCDTRDADGVFRKYGAFVIGDRIVPRGVMFSRHWMVKDHDLKGPEFLREQRAYIEGNPHAGWLADLARRARLGYGRVDYALKDGVPQVWEINTNPTVVMPRHTFTPSDEVMISSSMDAIGRAIESLDP
jgi:hypothetical protein